MAQNLDTFVIQIRNLNSRQIMGTGFMVSIEGLIATCWHVVERTGADPAQTGTRISIGLSGESVPYSAVVLAGLKTDDVSILQLEQILPFGWSCAILGSSEAVEGHAFRTKGYSVLGRYIGVRAEGRILGPLEVEAESPPQFPPLHLYSQQIDQGMSGAPILSLETNRVVGMVSEIWVPPRGFRQRDTVFAIPSESLIACYPDLSPKPPTKRPPVGLSDSITDVSQMLQLKGYRVLDSLEVETGLLFKCEEIENGKIKPVLISVVEGKGTPADKERLRQLCLSAGINHGWVLGTSEEENHDHD